MLNVTLELQHAGSLSRRSGGDGVLDWRHSGVVPEYSGMHPSSDATQRMIVS
jgi:hypothetical protein